MTIVTAANDDSAALVLGLGALQPKHPIETSLEAAQRIGWDAAAQILYRHKVSSIAIGRLVSYGGQDRSRAQHLARALSVASEPMKARWASAEGMHRRLEAAGRAAGVEWWVMKGMSMRRLYPASHTRDVGDVDLVVRSIDDAWALAAVLSAEGYDYMAGELPWFKKDVGSGALYGQIRLASPSRSQLSIDIHAGPYSIRHCGLMHQDSVRSVPSYGSVSLEDDMCAVLANAAGDCFITLKALNDITLGLSATKLDVSYVRDRLDSADLLPFFAATVVRMAELVHLGAEQSRRLKAIVGNTDPEAVPHLATTDREQRCATTVAHARRVMTRLYPEHQTLVEQVAEGAEEAYGRDHPLRISHATASSGTLASLNNWTCIRLVPVETVAELVDRGARDRATFGPSEPFEGSALRVVPTSQGNLVEAAGRLFVPTVDFAIPSGLVEAVAERP